MISIVTPWRNHPELLPAYQAAVAGADVVIVDNSAGPCVELIDACFANGWTRRPGAPGLSFAQSNNAGLAYAAGDIVVFLNNDIVAPNSWLAQIQRDVKPGNLYGPALTPRYVDGSPLLYLEGWCIAATRATWEQLGGWDEAYLGGYWEDNDLCFRALQLGLGLRRTTWPVTHLSNTTAKDLPGAYDHSFPNYERFVARVRAARKAVAA